jgi:hypothetical protein
MSIGPEETLIEGSWVMENGRMSADEAEKRINGLVKSDLEYLASASGCWEILYKDPRDGRYWERSFPQSEMQGGGPKLLRNLSVEEARSKYRGVA